MEVLLPPPPPPAAPTPLFLPSTSEADMEVDMGMDMDIEQDTSVDRFMSAVSDPAVEGAINGHEQRDPSETESQMADRVVKDALKTLVCWTLLSLCLLETFAHPSLSILFSSKSRRRV